MIYGRLNVFFRPDLLPSSILSLGTGRARSGEMLGEGMREWQVEAISFEMKLLAEHFDVKMKQFMMPLFIAISGKKVATPIIAAMVILGQDLSCARIRYAINHLGGVSKKETKKWQKEFCSVSIPETAAIPETATGQY